MNHDEILQAAREATNNQPIYGRKEFTFSSEELKNFAAIIEKRTIERCAAIADRVEELADALNDKISDDDDHNEWRSEYVMGKAQAANRIAAAIRKLGEEK